MHARIITIAHMCYRERERETEEGTKYTRVPGNRQPLVNAKSKFSPG